MSLDISLGSTFPTGTLNTLYIVDDFKVTLFLTVNYCSSLSSDETEYEYSGSEEEEEEASEQEGEPR